ncbi:hypothetical protein ANAPRD1_01368 [Anaplasma phagocytophilum]|nr:hypothetical protein ANAPRD1_01368 [Anaplasma phagocytophilum]
MDHSVLGSMKNAASCETWCELQDTLSTYSLNAHCGLGPSRGFVCVRVGSYIKRGEFVFLPRFDCVGSWAARMFMLSCVAFSRSWSGDGANARVGARCTRALTSPPRLVLIERCIEKNETRWRPVCGKPVAR